MPGEASCHCMESVRRCLTESAGDHGGEALVELGPVCGACDTYGSKASPTRIESFKTERSGSVW
eukprot:m.147288 g.147288  ORF g.147288 m.147288 type:complete len:64 (-) comp23140_c0_seq1:1273-1464(-)